MREGGAESLDSCVGIIGVFVQQGDEAAAHDGACGVCTGCFEGLSVAHAEAYHPRVAQVHGGDALEVGLLREVEVTLGAGGGCAGHHVDEAVRMRVNFPDAFLAGFGSDEHDHFYSIAFGQCLEMFLVFTERQVGDDDPVDAASHALLAEVLEAELQDGVQITHQYEGDVYVATYVGQLLEEQAEGYSVAQGARGRFLYDHAVGHGVAEGDTYFYHSDSVALEDTNDIGRPVQGRASGAEVNGKQVLGLAFKKLVDTVLHCDDVC